MPYYLTDRTTIETDQLCGMKRFWYKDFAGSGIVPIEEAEYYRQGRLLHADYAAVAAGADPRGLVRSVLDQALSQPFSQLGYEHAWWHAGSVWAFAQFVWPIWAATYEPILIEKELVLDRSPLQIACTADLVLRGHDRGPSLGKIIVIDYKSVGWLTGGWTLHWPYAVQMLINAKAVEEALGVTVDATYVMGVQKGTARDGKLRHPYVYAYVSPDESVWQSEWKSGWILTGLWERGQDQDRVLVGLDDQVDQLIAWVNDLGPQTALDLHPTSAPIFQNDRMLDALIRARVRREDTLAAVKDAAQVDHDLRETHYEPRYIHCRPTVGSVCPYLAACHNHEVNADPVGSGLYVPRTPHHDMEWLDKAGS